MNEQLQRQNQAGYQLIKLHLKQEILQTNVGHLVVNQDNAVDALITPGSLADQATLSRMLPILDREQLTTKCIKPANVSANDASMNGLQFFVGYVVVAELVRYVRAQCDSPGSARVDDSTPDFASFPKTVIGRVVLEANKERNCRTDQRDG